MARRNGAGDGEDTELVDADDLGPDETLSPELVLVLPPELRAEAIARLGEPVWPRPRLRLAVPEPPRPSDVPAPAEDSLVRALGAALSTRVVNLAMVFVFVTILTLAMSALAHAFR